MPSTQSSISMPEFLVFIRPFAAGFVIAEIWRIAFQLGQNFSPLLQLSDSGFWVMAAGLMVGALIVLAYLFGRGTHTAAGRMVGSFRLDVLAVVCIGVWANELTAPFLAPMHVALENADPLWAPAILSLCFAILVSPLLRHYLLRSESVTPQLYFIADEEIQDEKEDLFASESHAKSFADTVLASSAHSGLIFGVDGPWGVGKTSFMNLVQQHWERAEDQTIVCRFEPLRYASEPDLTDRLIRDLSAAIQRKVFVPEFRPAASRYSRFIKGKADFSFLGFRLSLAPSQETVDELLDSVDEVLRQTGRRVIIVIDDLDRLDMKTVNNVLFAARRTFKLSQATYILCYDTEVLAGGEEDAKAREFLEKFVTVKLSLFVDSSKISDFLRRDWLEKDSNLGSIPADTMVKLGAVLNELAEILDGELAAHYLPLIGDLRKVKRFVNAMLLMQMEKSDLSRTDFNKRDLINLMLLHLHYPGIFRRIYSEETEGRQGSFSAHREYGKNEFENSSELSEITKNQTGSARFLLEQLFDVDVLGLVDMSGLDESELASRACFNQDSYRNLERYLKLIVRIAMPEPQSTFVLYQRAVEKVLEGTPVALILQSHDFRLEIGEHAHDQFWRVLVNQSRELYAGVAEDVIATLIEYLPKYSYLNDDGRGLRRRSIYSLLMLLERAGWGRTSGRRLPNTRENILEIAWRVFGEKSFSGKGLIQRLVSSDRGVLGWDDLMVFRLQCSADRQGQLHNIHSALIVHADENAETSGAVSRLALIGMRRISQEIFALFKRDFVHQERNYFSEVDSLAPSEFYGEAPQKSDSNVSQNNEFLNSSDHLVSIARTTLKTFVIYQLSNSSGPTGSGIGCGYYDEQGTNDAAGISSKMNDYVFDFCFNPEIREDNFFHFLDYCLSNLSSSFFSGRLEEGYFPSKNELSGGLSPRKMGLYWHQHRELIRNNLPEDAERYVYTLNYRASYSEDLPEVFDVLDELAEDAMTTDADTT